MAADPIEWDEAKFDAARVLAGTGLIDARGTRLSSARLRDLLGAVPVDSDQPGGQRSVGADFTGAMFDGSADFRGVRFTADARFDRATFNGPADFRGVTFTADARFDQATFNDVARFDDATVAGESWFDRATFCGESGFERADFTGDAKFISATFCQAARFFRAKFKDGAGFDGATFRDASRFDDARFGGRAGFDKTTFSRNAHFDRVIFELARDLGPLFAAEALDLRRATFEQLVRIQVSSREVVLDGATFNAGGDVLARWAEISLEETDFAGPSLVTHSVASAGSTDERAFFGQEEPLEDGGWKWPRSGSADLGLERRSHPRVITVQQAKVAHLTLSSVDLSACQFAGAHGLDGLRLEHTRLARPPSGWRRRRRYGWWTRRQTIAEEHAWRARHGHGAGWDEDDDAASAPESQDSGGNLEAEDAASAPESQDSGGNLEAEDAASAPESQDSGGNLEAEDAASAPESQDSGGNLEAEDAASAPESQDSAGNLEAEDAASAPESQDSAGNLEAEDVASVYRELRKGREDDKDEAGAADFYYGEMEMRRQRSRGATGSNVDFGRPVPWAERQILWLYWLVAGYGLRASRALIALAVLIGLFTSGLYLYGFRDRSRPYATAAELQAVPGKPSQTPFPPSVADVLDGWGSLDAWTYSAGTATAVIGAPDAQLTQEGRAMRIPLRVLGPILIGLGLLAIRGRVRR